jgi:predicted phosphodiesterase
VIAVLYDIHGNLPALEAVLADAVAAGADEFLLGGDYALFGPWPEETLARLKQIPAATRIRGNVDRWTAFPNDLPDDDVLHRAVADCRAAIGEVASDALGALPEQVVVGGTRYCHASPASDMSSFLPEPTDDEDDLLAGVTERRIVFGHTHLQFRRLRDNAIELVNPGSVGLPLDGDHRAAYALVLDDGSLALRRVSYDHERSAAAVVERFGDVPWATRSARRLREARA